MIVSGLDDRPDDRHRRCRLNCCHVDGTGGGAREILKEAKACRKHGDLLVSEWLTCPICVALQGRVTESKCRGAHTTVGF